MSSNGKISEVFNYFGNDRNSSAKKTPKRLLHFSRLDIRGWGGEDVDLFKKMVADPDLEVMSMVDPDLIHIYHKRGCDVNLSKDQYAMCVGAWAETLGSQLQVASLYIDSHRDG